MKLPGESRHAFFCRRLRELGMTDPDSDYDGMVGKWVEELSMLLATQRHSGQSYALTLSMLIHLTDEWERPDAQPDLPNLPPAATFDAQAQAIADAATSQAAEPNPQKLFFPKEDPVQTIDGGPVPCRGCGRPVYWLTSSKTGKRMPFDLLVVHSVHGRGYGVELSKNHWATCPKAADFKR